MMSRFFHLLAAILLVGNVSGMDGDPPMLLATAPSGAFRLLWAGKGIPIWLVPAQATQPFEPLVAAKINDLAHRFLPQDQLESSDALNSPPLTFISPDERWIFVQRSVVFGGVGILYRRTETPGPQGLPRYLPATTERFDSLAWQFYSKETKVPMDEISKPNPHAGILRKATFGGWSADSGRLLLDLQYREGDSRPPWYCYFNTQTQTFEQTERLRAAALIKPVFTEEGRLDRESTDGRVLNPESIGKEGPETPVLERFTKADTELNRVYSELILKLTPSAQTQLRSEQRQWIIERDAYASAHAIQSWSLRPAASRIEGQAIISEKRSAELAKRLTGH